MYQIIFYTDKNGESEIYQYIMELKKNKAKNKNYRIKYYKVASYIDALASYGLRLTSKYVKHLEGEIWELRPLRDRILFAYFAKDKFILLSQFIKKTQKTPRREIEKAKRLLKEWSDEYE